MLISWCSEGVEIDTLCVRLGSVLFRKSCKDSTKTYDSTFEDYY